MFSFNVGQQAGAVEAVPTPEPTARNGAVGAGVRR
jgi:hypothetical protein